PLISYNDTFTISKSDIEKAGSTSFNFTIPKAYADSVVSLPKPFSVSVFGVENPDLFTLAEESGDLVLTTTSNSLLGLAQGNYVNFSIAYRIVIPAEQYAIQLKNVTFPLKFATTLPVSLFSANISVPQGKLWATPTYFEQQTLHNRTVAYMKFPAEETQTFSLFSILLSSYPASFTSFTQHRTITLDPLFGLTVEEEYAARSDPLEPQSTIPPVFITDQATDISAKDLIGPITSTIHTVENSTLQGITVTPRFSLSTGGNYTFFVDYKIPASNFTSRNGDTLTIRIPAASNFSQLVTNYTVTLNLPIGAKVERIELGQVALQGLSNPSSGVASVSIKDLPLDVLSQNLTITVNYPLLWTGYTPSALVFVVGAALLGTYYIALRKPAEEEKVEAAPSLKLAADVARSMRKSVALFSQIQELEIRYYEGDINRKEFRGVHQKLRSDLDRALSEVRDSSRRLIGVSSQYASRVRNYDGLWAELQAKHASQREVGYEYLNKKISRAAYSELSERYSREISDTISKIRSLLEDFPSS
ncbi:MAG TPA: hypothetical protein VEG31_04075, partial [Thermoproteota archaeon]|nr:hypothetical protein [Thermoproteota archaeon]